MKKIGIIGGGAAGSAAAWALSKKYEVTLFEAESYLGGHAYTHEVEVDETKVSIDMGVEYYHERLSPNLSALLNYFKLDSYIAPLSFKAFSQTHPETHYWSNNQLEGIIKQKLNDEMNRFHIDMLSVIQKPDAVKGMSVQDFLNKNQYSIEFRQQALLPLTTTFSGCRAPSLDYSLLYFALSFNMNLLSFFTPCYWRKVKNGIHSYLKKIHQELGDKVKLNSPVTSVEKTENKVVVTLADNTSYYFDEVIFACQAYIAKKLIKNIDQQQYNCLDAFEYVDVQSTLHTDKEAVSKQPLTNEYCQFELTTTPCDNFTGILTRVNHHLYPYKHLTTPLYVSFDNRDIISPETIISKKDWKLPKLRPIDILSKRKMSAIQGKNNLWYCGTDYSLTGHEGALVSGLVIAKHLGADYPFEDQWLARAQFDLIKSFMGIYTKNQKIKEKFISLLMNISKFLNLHQRLSGRFIKELFF